MTLSALSARGSLAQPNSVALWSSSNSGVATVDDNGLVTAVAPGETTIAAVIGGLAAETTLTVTNATLVDLSLDLGKKTAPVTVVKPLHVEGFFSDGSTQDITDVAAFNSSNPAVATISPSGLLEGVALGNTTISVALAGIEKRQALELTSATLDGIRIEGPSTLFQGSGREYQAYAIYSDGNIGLLFGEVAWSANPGDVLQVQPDTRQMYATVRAVAPGTATLSASQGGATGTQQVTVQANATNLSVEGPEGPLVPGSRYRLRAMTTVPAQGSVDVAEVVAWSSSAPSVATVEKGVLRVRSSGQATITATAPGQSAPVTAKFEVDASEAALQALNVSSGNHTFDTSTGAYDGTVLSGWSEVDGQLNLSSLTIATGATLTLSGGQPFNVLADQVTVAGTLDGVGTSGATNLPGGNGYLVRLSAPLQTLSGTINHPGGAGGPGEGPAGGDRIGPPGGSGGSGGSFVSLAESFSLTGSISAAGGVGGRGTNEIQAEAPTYAAPGGRGGDGGQLSLRAATIQLEGAIDLGGGVGGPAGNAFERGQVGGAGGNGGDALLVITDPGPALTFNGGVRVAGGDGGAPSVGFVLALSSASCDGGNGGNVRMTCAPELTLTGMFDARGGAGVRAPARPPRAMPDAVGMVGWGER